MQGMAELLALNEQKYKENVYNGHLNQQNFIVK